MAFRQQARGFVMRKRLVFGTILVVLVGLGGRDARFCVSTAAPAPQILQRAGLWTATVTFEHPQQIVLPSAGGERRFWYMIVSVTNRSGRDIDFYPRCDLMTDTFELVPAGRGVPAAVFEMIKQRHGAAYPFLESFDRVDSRLLQGEDNAKDLIIAWRDFDLQATSFKVFLGGLSNETAAVRHPVAVDDAGQPVQVFLRKTLQLDYTLLGDPAIRPALQTEYTGQSWVMR
jgi:hypothetical protein